MDGGNFLINSSGLSFGPKETRFFLADGGSNASSAFLFLPLLFEADFALLLTVNGVVALGVVVTEATGEDFGLTVLRLATLTAFNVATLGLTALGEETLGLTALGVAAFGLMALGLPTFGLTAL